MSIATARLSILYSDQDHCLCSYGNSILTFSLHPPSPAYLAAWTKAMDELVQRTHGPIAVLIIIDCGARAPDEHAKKEIRNTTIRHGKSIGAFGYVIEGEGFGAAAMRSAVSLISLAARYPFPQKVFKNADDAARWMLPLMAKGSTTGVKVPGMLSAVEVMRQQLKQLAAAG